MAIAPPVPGADPVDAQTPAVQGADPVPVIPGADPIDAPITSTQPQNVSTPSLWDQAKSVYGDVKNWVMRTPAPQPAPPPQVPGAEAIDPNAEIPNTELVRSERA